MSIAQARELLVSPDSSLDSLIDCLVLLSNNCGYIEAVKKFNLRSTASSDESLSEFYSYIEQIKSRIANYAQTNI